MPSIEWSTLKAQIGRKLNDPTYSKYSEQLLLDLVNDALIHFASVHTGVKSDFDIVGDGEAYSFDLPDNIVDTEQAGVYGVELDDQTWLREQPYWAGMQFPSDTRDTDSSPVAYTMWPTDQISLTRVPSLDEVVALHYVAYYPEVTDDTSVITVPYWAREAIKCYVCSEALGPGSVKTAQLRQYQSRREAGKPEDNPLLARADRFVLRYYQILAEHRTPQYKQDVSTENFK